MSDFTSQGKQRIGKQIKQLERAPVVAGSTPPFVLPFRPPQDWGVSITYAKAKSTITARVGAKLGTGPATLFKVADDGTMTTLSQDITLFSVKDCQITSGTYMVVGRAGGKWSVLEIAPCGSNASRPGSCGCPEATYEVMVHCDKCTIMPKYWWLTLRDADQYYYGYYGYCEKMPCGQLTASGRIKLTNVTNDYGTSGYDSDGTPIGYGAATCVWDGTSPGLCISAELTLVGTVWQITVIEDIEGCVLGVWTKPVADFQCCATNEGWTAADGNKCMIDILLEPHECTCCGSGGTPCPPEDKRVCNTANCCIINQCIVDVTVINLFTPLTLPCTIFDTDCCAADGTTCPFPIGDIQRSTCVQCSSIVTPDKACGGMNGVYQMRWQGSDCTWEFYDFPATGGLPTKVRGKLTLGGTKWELKLEGANGQTANFSLDDWHCERTVILTYEGGSCPVSVAPTASFTLDLPLT